MDCETIDIIPTSNEITLAIPTIFYNDFAGILDDTVNNIANTIANKYNIDPTQVIQCRPTDIFYAIPKPLDITNKEQLNKFTISKLHELLSIKGLSLAGSKQILVERVWNSINNIDSAKDNTNNSNRKKKRKKKLDRDVEIISRTSVDDSDLEEEDTIPLDENILEIDSLIAKSEKVYIDKYGKKLKKPSKNTMEYIYISEYNWVLERNDDNKYKLLGGLIDNRLDKNIEKNMPKGAKEWLDLNGIP